MRVSRGADHSNAIGPGPGQAGVASTRAGLVSAVLAGIGALKGPLHGGAPGPVIEMLDAIGAPANARPWLETALDHGDRLMGFGHRIYRVRDPRADALKGALARLDKLNAIDGARAALATRVEAVALAALKAHKPDRPLETNVEFYTALVLEAVGLPREAFTAVFAVGRVAGWCAHILEQEQTGRIIRHARTPPATPSPAASPRATPPSTTSSPNWCACPTWPPTPT